MSNPIQMLLNGPGLIRISLTISVSFILMQCKEQAAAEKNTIPSENTVRGNDMESPPSDLITDPPAGSEAPEGMVWVPGGQFMQGAVARDMHAMPHEKPSHPVVVDGFYIDRHEVTNAQFAEFVEKTGYVTVAERELDWEELKHQLPEGTPRPADSILQPGALVFKKTPESVPNLYDFSQWWKWKIGASWKSPHGPGSSIEDMENHPVVQISYEDALAYCEWSGRRLPTEAEWEYAARGRNTGGIYSWGDEESVLSKMANTWNGEFPVRNDKTDGFEGHAPVMNYPPNGFGLYDMSGNVWEWTSDWYDNEYYSSLRGKGMVRNPKGPGAPHNPANPYARERVIKGGSFLCNASYCASYRVSARMASSTDSALEHLGFRTVLSAGHISPGEEP
jgi:formylglycine-generating enzyme required for sulfatase activity